MYAVICRQPAARGDKHNGSELNQAGRYWLRLITREHYISSCTCQRRQALYKEDKHTALVPEQERSAFKREWSYFQYLSWCGIRSLPQVRLRAFVVPDIAICSTASPCFWKSVLRNASWRQGFFLFSFISLLIFDHVLFVVSNSCVRQCPHSRCCCAHRNLSWSKQVGIRPRVRRMKTVFGGFSTLTGNIPPLYF